MESQLSADALRLTGKPAWARTATLALALTVIALAVGGMAAGFYLRDTRPGTSQLEYQSIEPFGTAPGARLFYHPEMSTVVVRGWLMPRLGATGVYEVWAVGPDGAYLSLGHGDADVWVGFTLVAKRAGLEGITRYVITREPPGGSVSAPHGPLIAELVRWYR